MSSRFKFRAWCPGLERMQTPDDKWGGDVFIRLNGEKVICIDVGEWLQGYDVGFTKDNLNLVIMQFTGLLDIKGVEIYEGDIVTRDGKWKKQVKWNPKRAAFNIFEDTSPTLEIIGNIYENPELLNNT